MLGGYYNPMADNVAAMLVRESSNMITLQSNYNSCAGFWHISWHKPCEPTRSSPPGCSCRDGRAASSCTVPSSVSTSSIATSSCTGASPNSCRGGCSSIVCARFTTGGILPAVWAKGSGRTPTAPSVCDQGLQGGIQQKRSEQDLGRDVQGHQAVATFMSLHVPAVATGGMYRDIKMSRDMKVATADDNAPLSI